MATTKSLDHDRDQLASNTQHQESGPAPGRGTRSDALVGPTGVLPSGLLQRQSSGNAVRDNGDGAATAMSARVAELIGHHERQRTLAETALSAAATQSARIDAKDSRTNAAAPTASETSNAKPPLLEAPLQRRAAGPMPAGDRVQAIAAEGIAGGGSTLPHLATIQRSFGIHDVSDVAAHTSGAASTACDALGAHAFATGNSIAFRQQPDLHTAAHEAAHIVQQRHGATPRAGIGDPGDDYERHADAVADRVVRGESAEAMLATPEHHNAGDAVQFLYNTNLPAPTVDNKFLEPQQNPELYRFLDHVRAVKTSTLEEANEASTMLRVAIALKKSAIDKALAADRASGVKLEPGLEATIIDYQKESKLATSAAAALGGMREQILGLGIEGGGVRDKKDVDLRKDSMSEASAEEQANSEAEIRKARRQAEVVGDAAVDVMAAIGKGLLNRKEVGGAVVDGGVGLLKGGFHAANDALANEEVSAGKQQLKAKWDRVGATINKDNAVAISSQLEGIRAQISGMGPQIESKKSDLNTHLVASWQLEKTILKNKSQVTALAPIQEFLREVPVKASALKAALARARSVTDWDYWGIGNAATRQLAFTNDEKHSHAKEIRDELARVQAGIVDAQLWFAAVQAERTAQEEFVNGPIMEPAESALLLIADLGGTGAGGS